MVDVFVGNELPNASLYGGCDLLVKYASSINLDSAIWFQVHYCPNRLAWCGDLPDEYDMYDEPIDIARVCAWMVVP
jgi:hypothetical protein